MHGESCEKLFAAGIVTGGPEIVIYELVDDFSRDTGF